MGMKCAFFLLCWLIFFMLDYRLKVYLGLSKVNVHHKKKIEIKENVIVCLAIVISIIMMVVLRI